jgi:hypothetical protein
MFIELYFKHNRTTNKRYTVYKLCESYRLNGCICHHIIINFGRLESLETVEQKKLLAGRVEQLLINGSNTLSTIEEDEQVEQFARHFYNEIINKKRIVCDDGNGVATSISCPHKTGEDTNKQAGIYFLRTSIMNLDEHTFWTIYNTICEIEYTFRVLKTDLELRPI